MLVLWATTYVNCIPLRTSHSQPWSTYILKGILHPLKSTSLLVLAPPPVFSLLGRAPARPSSRPPRTEVPGTNEQTNARTHARPPRRTPSLSHLGPARPHTVVVHPHPHSNPHPHPGHPKAVLYLAPSSLPGLTSLSACLCLPSSRASLSQSCAPTQPVTGLLLRYLYPKVQLRLDLNLPLVMNRRRRVAFAPAQ